MAMRTFTKLYDSYDDATHVVSALEAAGVPSDDISLVANRSDTTTATDGSTTGVTSGDPEQGAETGAGTGATLGTILGGGAGLLAGIGMLAIPGVGPIVAAGWLVATLTGAGVGAAAGGLLGSLTGAGVSEADAEVYAEGVRRGGALVTVRAEETEAERIESILGGRSYVDPTARRSEYEQTGWTGYRDEAVPADADAATAGMAPVGGAAMSPAGTFGMGTADGTTVPPRTAGMATGTTSMNTTSAGVASSDPDTLKVMEERLVVGKREVETGGVKVQAKVVETPVQEQVRLHEEKVTLERRPVDRPADPADLDAFQSKTLEAKAHSEEAVVKKEARVVEEIGLRKEGTDRVETVNDSVRRTEVDVVDNTGKTTADRTASTTSGTVPPAKP